MRRTGKTTRSVDKAIQKLFRYGEITVPSKGQIDSGTLDVGIEEGTIIVDPDWMDGDRVQDHLRSRILRRLQEEHKPDIEISNSRIILKKS